jgi:hypothetical protein
MQIIMELLGVLLILGMMWAVWISELIIQEERLSKYKGDQ